MVSICLNFGDRRYPNRQREAPISTGSKLSSEDRPRGPKPKKFDQTRQAMKHDIRERRLTVTKLRGMPEKAMAERYGVSRDTARKARSAVLSEFVEESNHDK